MSDRAIATVTVTAAAVAGAAVIAGLTWLAEAVRAGIAVLAIFGGGVL